jgi:tetratricopeptide (TPR) repeat protein
VLDDTLGEAHASLALCLKSFDWDWKAAERELSRAIQLSPSYATAHQWYAWNLIILGQNNEGISHLKKAAALDPLSLRWRWTPASQWRITNWARH